MKNEEMALLFSEATPYIQKYHGKTLVIKYGGNAMVNEELKLAVMNDLVTLTLLGVRVVLVHGGGPAINQMLNRVGKESKFVNGLRYTDKETMSIVQQVLAGQVNKDLVALLKGRGVGLCGLDGHTITEPLLNHIEVAIRAFDLCLSCATHALGKMPLAVELVDPEGQVIHSLSRS